MDTVNRSVRYRVKQNLRTAASDGGRMFNGGSSYPVILVAVWCPCN